MNHIKTLGLIHLSFCGSIIALAICVGLINKDLFIFDFTLNHPEVNTHTLSFIAVILTVVSMNLGTYLFKKMIDRIDETEELDEKIIKYQTAFLIKCALLEAAALFSLVMCLVTYNFYFIIVAAFPFFSLWLMKPSKSKVYDDLRIQDPKLF